MWRISAPKRIASATSGRPTSCWRPHQGLASVLHHLRTADSGGRCPCLARWHYSQAVRPAGGHLSNAPHSGPSFPTCHTAKPCSVLVCRPSTTGVSTCVELSQLRRWRTPTWPTGSQAGAARTTCATTTMVPQRGLPVWQNDLRTARGELYYPTIEWISQGINPSIPS